MDVSSTIELTWNWKVIKLFRALPSSSPPTLQKKKEKKIEAKQKEEGYV